MSTDALAASTEATTPEAPSSPSVFGDSTPDWVKSAGLSEAHSKATPAKAAVPESTPSAQPAATPAAQPSQPTPPATQPAPQPLAIDHKALAQAIREGNTPAPTGPSDEELSRQLGIVTLTPEIYKATFGVDGTPEQVKALNDYGQGIAKQAVTIAKILFDREITSLRDSFAPYIETIKTQERDRIKSEFFKSNADLTNYEPVVTQQYQLALASGKKFASVAEAGKYVADQTRAHLTSLGVKLPSPNAAPAAATKPSTSAGPVPQTRQMSSHSMGGKGNAAPSGAPAAKSSHESIWG